jgi:hypothetical protein
MKTKVLITVWCIGCTALILLAFQGGDKKTPRLDTVKKIVSLADTTILPDTTLAKIDTLLMKENELKQLNEVSKNKLYSERIETKLMRNNSSTLEDIARREATIDQIPNTAITSSAPKYPDTLTIIIKKERRSIFKRKRQ